MVCASTTEPHGIDTGVGFSGAGVSLGVGVGDNEEDGAGPDVGGASVGMRSSPGERQPPNETATTTPRPARALRAAKVRIIMVPLSPTQLNTGPCNAAKCLIAAG